MVTSSFTMGAVVAYGGTTFCRSVSDIATHCSFSANASSSRNVCLLGGGEGGEEEEEDDEGFGLTRQYAGARLLAYPDFL